MSVLIIYIHVNAKAFHILIYGKRIQNILGRLELIRTEMLNDLNNENIIQRTESFLLKLDYGYTILMMMFPSISLLTNLFTDYFSTTETVHLPFQIYIPWDMNEFWPYIYGMLFTTLIVETACIYYTSFTILLFTVSFELSAILQVIQAKLEINGLLDRDTYRQHAHAVRIIQDWNDLYSGQLYLEILISSLQPCGFGYTLVKTVKQNNPDVLDLIYKSFIAVSAPYIVCACGQEVSNQMEKLHDSSYIGPWYNQSPKHRRDLLIMKTVMVSPLSFCFRRSVSFNNACFSTVAQGIYTYFTMITNIETS
ncbi:hypothetical protein O3M35_009740 [Rhynocoris fuscipes]|uniref:Odorant receptor n=1 Tax=Rhynocoris fuscipes TaxID=488301 RepID=A0AAW1D4U0_9HEMI